MKLSRLYFLPGGIPKFWEGKEERKSRLDANTSDPDMPKVELELRQDLGGLVQLMYGGQGPFFIGPNMIMGVVPLVRDPVAEDKALTEAAQAQAKKK